MKVIYNPGDGAIVPAYHVASLADGLGGVYVDQVAVTPIRGMDGNTALEYFRISSPDPRGIPTLIPTALRSRDNATGKRNPDSSLKPTECGRK